MKKTFLVYTASLIWAATGVAQTNDTHKSTFNVSPVIKDIRGLLKAENYAKADETIKKVWKEHAETLTNTELYGYELDVLERLALAENKKMYLSNKADTVRFFDYILQTYRYGLTLDSLDSQPYTDAKGKVKAAPRKYHTKVQQKLLLFRNNLVSAAKFHFLKKQYKESYSYFDMYLMTKGSTVFVDKKGANILPVENDVTDISVMAVLAAYGSDNYSGVVQHLHNALEDKESAEKILELGYKSYYQLADSVNAVATLQRAYEAYPDNLLFFSELIQQYNSKKEYTTAIDLAKTMISRDSNNRDYWYVLGKEYEYNGQSDEAIPNFNKSIELKVDDYESYSALGNIYLRKAQEAYNNFQLSVSDPKYRSGKKAIEDIYSISCKNFELARKYRENEPVYWLEGLREVYYRLNKGRELQELEKVK